ncbi:MAG: hypothetical protein JW982_15710 [Spirochaetes bacterium]|nr:hypothetical protein [Spirochaetota bacterium]
MDNNGQLTFSDDHLQPGINEAYKFIESGDFSEAVDLFNMLIDEKSDYPGLFEGYRTSRFWLNRKSELLLLKEGKMTADFLMNEWNQFNSYAEEKNMTGSTAFSAAQKYVFFTASEHYKIAFRNEESPTDNFSLLYNLARCFMGLQEFSHAAETLEYIRSAYKSNTQITVLLGESYFHLGETPKSLMFFREAFFLNPQEIDMKDIKAQPILDLAGITAKNIPAYQDIREWIPVYGYILDIFYVKHQLSKQTVEILKKDILNLEKSYQMSSKDKIKETNIVPRLINKYLWMFDYFSFQNYDFEAITDIRTRLIEIDRGLFEPYFKNRKDNK